MNKVVTLVQLKSGEKAKVIGISVRYGPTRVHGLRLGTARRPSGRHGPIRRHGLGQEFARRLQEMGIIPGSVIEVIRNASMGPVEISVMGTRLAIGRSIASRIYVEKYE